MEKTVVSQLIEGDDYRKIELFVRVGMEFNITDINCDYIRKFGSATNDAFLHALTGKVDCLKKMHTSLLQVENECGYTPIHWAVINNQNNVVAFLLSAINNTSLLSKTVDNDDLLMLAARFDNQQAFDQVLDKYLTNKWAVTSKNKLGFNCLHFACNNKNLLMIEKLIILCSDKHIFDDNIFGATPLHWMMHGRNCSDLNKLSLIQKIYLLMTKQKQDKEISRMLLSKNIINFSPIDWLIHYRNIKSLLFIKSKLTKLKMPPRLISV